MAGQYLSPPRRLLESPSQARYDTRVMFGFMFMLYDGYFVIWECCREHVQPADPICPE